MNIVLCSTVHPAVLEYFGEFYASVRAQEGPAFTLHLALDSVTVEELEAAVGAPIDAEFSVASSGDTPAMVRQRAWECICDRFDVAVLVDSDDTLHPSRVAAAVQGLRRSDVHGCALELTNAAGVGLDLRFGANEDMVASNWADSIALHNVFGLSNTAYRTPFLRSALPLPRDVDAVDWFVVTLALGAGAELTFDRVPRMTYRQHRNNLARVVPPFDLEHVRRASALVLCHHARVVERWPSADPAPGAARFEQRARTVRAFAEAIEDDALGLRYVDALNTYRTDVYAWWQAVAMPELEYAWKR